MLHDILEYRDRQGELWDCQKSIDSCADLLVTSESATTSECTLNLRGPQAVMMESVKGRERVKSLLNNVIKGSRSDGVQHEACVDVWRAPEGACQKSGGSLVRHFGGSASSCRGCCRTCSYRSTTSLGHSTRVTATGLSAVSTFSCFPQYASSRLRGSRCRTQDVIVRSRLASRR